MRHLSQSPDLPRALRAAGSGQGQTLKRKGRRERGGEVANDGGSERIISVKFKLQNFGGRRSCICMLGNLSELIRVNEKWMCVCGEGVQHRFLK